MVESVSDTRYPVITVATLQLLALHVVKYRVEVPLVVISIVEVGFEVTPGVVLSYSVSLGWTETGNRLVGRLSIGNVDKDGEGIIDVVELEV